MERECCLAILITVLGGCTLLTAGWWPAARVQTTVSGRHLESIMWRRIWIPIAPALTVVAWLCGWALAEPDPVPEKMPIALILIGLPFALLIARAVVRAARSLVVDQGDPTTATVGLLRAWIVFSPRLAKQLDDRQIEAALSHERAHARHRDPLRIWLAQLATDLQWPWPQARERMRGWLLALELARDEEARADGVDGAELADAILASARFAGPSKRSLQAALTGEAAALKQRIARLLAPLPDNSAESPAWACGALITFMAIPVLALVLGVIFGSPTISALFRLAS